MPSPAQRHRQRHLAQAVHSAATNSVSRANATGYELMLAKLAEDKRVLKSIQSVEQKIEVKRERLPDYTAWCTGVMQSAEPVQDDVFATCMVWSIDTGAIDTALIMAAYMLRHDLKLPEHYQRDVATTVVEEIADRAGMADGGNVTAANLLAAGQLTQGRDMPDEVRAKLHKATGLALREESPAQALEHLQRALQLNPRIGVKQEIAKLEKQLASKAPTAS